MKLCSCLGAISALTIVLAAPTLSPDASSKHTIWAESTITSMRNSSNAVYEATQFLYNNRGIFDNDAAANCSAGQYDGSNSVCARADAVRISCSTPSLLSPLTIFSPKGLIPEADCCSFLHRPNIYYLMLGHPLENPCFRSTMDCQTITTSGEPLSGIFRIFTAM